MAETFHGAPNGQIRPTLGIPRYGLEFTLLSFFLIQRQLFLHRYFLALYFSILTFQRGIRFVDVDYEFEEEDSDCGCIDNLCDLDVCALQPIGVWESLDEETLQGCEMEDYLGFLLVSPGSFQSCGRC